MRGRRLLELLHPIGTVTLTPHRRSWVEYIRPIGASLGQGCSAIVSGERFGCCLPLLVSLTTALDVWLTLGPLVQGTIMAAAVLRRLRGKESRASGGTNVARTRMDMAVEKDT